MKETVKSQAYEKILKKVDLNALGLKLLKIDSVDVAIKDDRLHIMMNVSSGLTSMFGMSSALKFDVSSALKVSDGKINVYDVRLENANKRLNIAKYISLFNYIDPLQYSLDAFSIKNGKLMIKTVDITDDKILFDGIIFIPKK